MTTGFDLRYKYVSHPDYRIQASSKQSQNLNEIVARGSAYACTVHSIPHLRTVRRLEAGWFH
jgi:hypothetical protein